MNDMCLIVVNQTSRLINLQWILDHGVAALKSCWREDCASTKNSIFTSTSVSPLDRMVSVLGNSHILTTVFFVLLQMVIDIVHPGRANVAKSELQEVIGQMHKADPKLVIVFGCRTKFGGGKSTGFCLIYDNEESCLKFEPKYRLVRNGMFEKAEQSRKAIKEAKNKGKKIRGTGRSIAKHKAKRAAQAD